MVNLLSGSSVDQSRFPTAFRWDDLVRRHFSEYQQLIDAQTYRIQRIQRSWLSLPYPKFYNTELLTLRLLKRKQEIGQVDQTEVDLYKNIDPCIATHFNRAFNARFNIPFLGLGLGGFLFAYTSYFNSSIPTRAVLTVIPVVVDWIRLTSDPKNEQHSLDFLDWVVGYRKAKTWVQLHRKEFESEQTKKTLGGSNLAELGSQLIILAGK